MRPEHLGAAALIVTVLVSAMAYRHRESEYRRGKTRRIDSPASFAAVHRYLQVSTLGLGLLSFLVESPWLAVVRPGGRALPVGLGIMGLGLALFVASKRTLGASYSPCFDSFVSTELVQRGPYAWVRHPIYTANVAILVGVFVATGCLWLALNPVLLGVYYHRSAVAEEQALSRSLPGYADYRRRTGRFLPRHFLPTRLVS